MQQNQHKYYTFFCMLFMAVSICDVLLVYRLVRINDVMVTAGVFVMPIYYLLQDIVAEIYGYKKAQHMILLMIICMYVFSFIITVEINLPTPVNWQHNSQYQFVLGHLFRTNIFGLLAVLSGAFINIKLITYWKTLLKGRVFWLRSLCSSAIGEIVASLIGSFVLYFHVYSVSVIIKLLIPVSILLIIQNMIYAFPGLILVNFLKKKEPGYSEVELQINPFKTKTGS